MNGCSSWFYQEGKSTNRVSAAAHNSNGRGIQTLDLVHLKVQAKLVMLYPVQ